MRRQRAEAADFDSIREIIEKSGIGYEWSTIYRNGESTYNNGPNKDQEVTVNGEPFIMGCSGQLTPIKKSIENMLRGIIVEEGHEPKSRSIKCSLSQCWCDGVRSRSWYQEETKTRGYTVTIGINAYIPGFSQDNYWRNGVNLTVKLNRDIDPGPWKIISCSGVAHVGNRDVHDHAILRKFVWKLVELFNIDPREASAQMRKMERGKNEEN